MVRPKRCCSEYGQIQGGLDEYDSILLDREANDLKSSGVSEEGIDVLLVNKSIRARVERISEEFGLGMEQVATVACRFPVRNDEEMIAILSSGIFPSCYPEQPFRRLEQGGQVYFIPADINLKSDKLGACSSFRIEDSDMHIVYAERLSGRDIPFSDLDKETRALLDNLYEGSYRDNPNASSHSIEHRIEEPYRG
jgi:hypothetical protein